MTISTIRQRTNLPCVKILAYNIINFALHLLLKLPCSVFFQPNLREFLRIFQDGHCHNIYSSSGQCYRVVNARAIIKSHWMLQAHLLLERCQFKCLIVWNHLLCLEPPSPSSHNLSKSDTFSLLDDKATPLSRSMMTKMSQ